MQSQSRLFSSLTCIPYTLSLPFLFLPVSECLMAVPVLQMFSPTAVKSKCSYALSEISWFYDLEKRGAFGYRMLWDNRTEVFQNALNWHNWDPCSHAVGLWNFAALVSPLCCRCGVLSMSGTQDCSIPQPFISSMT